MATVPQEILTAAGWVTAAAAGFAAAYAFIKKETQAATDAVKIDLLREIDELKQELAVLRLGIGRSRTEVRRAQLVASQHGDAEVVALLEGALKDLDNINTEISL